MMSPDAINKRIVEKKRKPKPVKQEAPAFKQVEMSDAEMEYHKPGFVNEVPENLPVEEIENSVQKMYGGVSKEEKSERRKRREQELLSKPRLVFSPDDLEVKTTSLPDPTEEEEAGFLLVQQVKENKRKAEEDAKNKKESVRKSVKGLMNKERASGFVDRLEKLKKVTDLEKEQETRVQEQEQSLEFEDFEPRNNMRSGYNQQIEDSLGGYDEEEFNKQGKEEQVYTKSEQEILNELTKNEKELSELSWWQFIKKSKVKGKIEDLRNDLRDIKRKRNKQEKMERLSSYKDLSKDLKAKSAELNNKVKEAKRERNEQAKKAFNERYEATKNLDLVNKYLERAKLHLDNNKGRKELAKKAGYASLLLGVGALTGGGLIATGVTSTIGTVAAAGVSGSVVGGFKAYLDKWRGKIKEEELRKKMITNAAFGAFFGASGSYLFADFLNNGVESVKKYLGVGVVENNISPNSDFEVVETVPQRPVRRVLPVQTVDSVVVPVPQAEPAASFGPVVEQEPVTPQVEAIYDLGQIELRRGESVWGVISSRFGGEIASLNAQRMHGKQLAEYIMQSIEEQNLPTGKTLQNNFTRIMSKPQLNGGEPFWRMLPTGLVLDLNIIRNLIK